MENPTNRAEAERLLGIAEKLLQNRDLNGSREFAILAQETEPLLDGSDQILAVADVLLAAEDRIGNKHHDWYAILHLDRNQIGGGGDGDIDAVKKQYRRLALLLHPDKNKFAHAISAFNLVSDAWAVLSDSSKRSAYDFELKNVFERVDLAGPKVSVNRTLNHRQSGAKLPVRRGANEKTSTESSFWTACPYCFVLYEYANMYRECCLRCQRCKRAFHAASIPSLPPVVPGKEGYYCCWGFFPLGFSKANSNWNNTGKSPATAAAAAGEDVDVLFTVADGNVSVDFDLGSNNAKKRGRPRKYPRQI